MATVTRWLRLPASPIENSIEGRAFVFSGFVVAALAIVLYGQDYVVPALGVVGAGIGHVVSYRRRNSKRGFWRQAVLAALVFGALFYVIADSSLALFGGTLPQANFAILLVAITSFDLKTRRNCYSSLWISLAMLYLAAVYAWDYAFGFLVALWALCLAGFWMTSHLKRLHAEVKGPVRPIASMLGVALVVGLLGGPLFRTAWHELRRSRLTIEALFLLTMTGAMAASLQAHLTGRGKIYFEVVSLLLLVAAVGAVALARPAASADRELARDRVSAGMSASSQSGD